MYRCQVGQASAQLSSVTQHRHAGGAHQEVHSVLQGVRDSGSDFKDLTAVATKMCDYLQHNVFKLHLQFGVFLPTY